MVVKEDHRYSVSEIFPAVQGEGALIGVPTIFLRFGGCDYRCSWCDSLYAVLPAYRHTWKKMNRDEIINALEDASSAIKHVTLSGGNPAIHPLGPLLDKLRTFGYTTAIETQGTIYPDWMPQIHQITVSPKPPSSGNTTEILSGSIEKFAHEGYIMGNTNFKVVIFDEEDYEYARSLHSQYMYIPMYLQVGTYQEEHWTLGEVRNQLLTSLDELQRRVMSDRMMSTIRVLPQLHTLIHGLKRGI